MPGRSPSFAGLLLTLLQLPLFAQPPADSALVLYLPFHANAQDGSAWHRRAVIHQAAYGPDRFGKPDAAFYANGAGAYVEILPVPALDLSGSLTISLWAKLEEPLPVNAELTLLWRGPVLLEPELRLGRNGIGVISVGGSYTHIPVSGHWDHHVVCYDQANGECRQYVNGRLKLTSKPPPRPAWSQSPLIIGGLVTPDNATEMWKGWIDDVRLYNRALTPAEVAALTEGYVFPSAASAYRKTGRLEPGRYALTPVNAQDSILWEPRLLVVPEKEPVWKKAWFILLFAAAAAAFSLLGAWYVYHQRQMEHALEFEKIRTLEAERFRIAREMHEDIGTGLNALRLLTDMALHKNLDPALAAEIEYIAASGQKVSDRIREIVWTIDMRHDTLEHLVVYFQQYATDYFHHAGHDLHVALPPRLPVALLPGNTRRMAFLAYKEALHNIVKHAHATRVDIDFAVAGRRLSIRVRDNGRGFDLAAVSDAGNGLVNMQKRMEDIGGSFRVASGAGGTTVRFEVGW